MSDRTKTVQCDKHGKGAATFICRHLAFGVKCGYHCSTDDPDDPWPDASCSGCDEVLEREGGARNDASEEFAGVTLACSGSYEDDKAWNETLSGPLRDRGELPEDVWAALLHDTVHATQRRQDEAIAQWQFTSHAKWRRDGALFRFLDPELPDLVCEVVVVGSWSASTRLGCGRGRTTISPQKTVETSNDCTTLDTLETSKSSGSLTGRPRRPRAGRWLPSRPSSLARTLSTARR